MKSRIEYFQHFPEAFNKIVEINNLLKDTSLSHELLHLIRIRASQINGCAFCVDMHAKEAKIDRVRDLKVLHVAVWKDSHLFDAKEQAALLWTEAVTKLSQEHVSDEVFGKLREHFSEKEIVQLNMAVAIINVWNRFAASFRSVPGSLDKMYGLDKAGL